MRWCELLACLGGHEVRLEIEKEEGMQYLIERNKKEGRRREGNGKTLIVLLSYNTPCRPLPLRLPCSSASPFTSSSPPPSPPPLPHLLLSTPPTPSPSTLPSPPRAPTETAYCTWLDHAPPFCAFLTFLIWPLVCCLVPVVLSNQNNTTRLVRPIVSSIPPAMPSRAPSLPYFFLVSLPKPPADTSVSLVHRTVLSAPFPLLVHA